MFNLKTRRYKKEEWQSPKCWLVIEGLCNSGNEEDHRSVISEDCVDAKEFDCVCDRAIREIELCRKKSRKFFGELKS